MVDHLTVDWAGSFCKLRSGMVAAQVKRPQRDARLLLSSVPALNRSCARPACRCIPQWHSSCAFLTTPLNPRLLLPQMDLLTRVGWRLQLDCEAGMPLAPLLLLLLLLAYGVIPLAAFPTRSNCTSSPLLYCPLPSY